jgi:AcrR family transcriptional regulator
MTEVRRRGPRSGVRTPRRVDRYEMILRCSAEVFRDHGYDATSLQQIADKVGILKGSLYHYIDTKEDLLFAIIERNHKRITTRNAGWRVVEDPVDAVRSFIEGHMRESLEDQVASEVFVRDFRALSPERARVIRLTQDGYDADFRALVRRAQQTGRLRDTVDDAFASRAIFGMTNWIYYWYRADGPATAAEVVARMADYAMASLAGPDRHEDEEN